MWWPRLVSTVVLAFTLGNSPATRPRALPLDELLAEAARDLRADHVKALLDTGADPNATVKQSSIFQLATFATLQSRGTALALENTHNASGSLTAVLEHLLDAGLRVEEIDSFSVMQIVGAGNTAAVRLLLEAGFNPRSDSGGHPLLVVAATQGKPDMIRLLLDAGVAIDPPPQNNRPASALKPLLAAATSADFNAIECVRLLLDAGVPVRPEERRARVQLAIAAAGANQNVRRLLITRGMDLSCVPVEDPDGANGLDPRWSPGNTAMRQAIIIGDVAAVQDLIAAGVDEPSAWAWSLAAAMEVWQDPDRYSSNVGGSTLKQVMADPDDAQRLRRDVLATARLLLAAGMPADWPEGGGLLAWRAAHLGDDALLDLLLEHGGRVDPEVLGLEGIAEPQGDAMLQIAYSNGVGFDPRLSERLNRAGVPVTLWLAAASGDVELTRAAIENSPFLSLAEAEGAAREQMIGGSLVYAVAEGRVETTRLLLEAGANPNALNARWGEPWSLPPPLLYAAARGHLGVIRLLLDAGADPNPKASSGETLLGELGNERPIASLMIRQAMIVRLLPPFLTPAADRLELPASRPAG